MKTKLVLKMAVLWLFVLIVHNAQAFLIEGKVLQQKDESPVTNHPVYFTYHQNSDSLMVFTNSDGAFSTDIELNDNDEVYIEIFTVDPCTGDIHHSAIYPFTSSNYILFLVCADENSGSECIARFEYYNGTFSQDSTSNPNDTIVNGTYTLFFYDLSMGNITNWYWNFGDGTISTEQNPVHNYSQQGEYMVLLIIQGPNCMDSIFSQVWVGNYEPNCTAYFYYDFGNTTNSDSTFSDSSTTDLLTLNFYDYSWGRPSEWKWSFGDGSTSTEQNPTHTYTESGEYFVSLYIAGENCESQYEMPVWVGNYLPPCQAMFGYDSFNWFDSTITYPDTNTTGYDNTIYFYDYSYGQIKEWNWDFGDGSVSSEQNPWHTYNQQGEYLVTLKILGENCESAYSSYVYVGYNDSVWIPEKCQALFYPIIENNNKVTFINQSYGNINSYLWNFGDGSVSTEVNPYYQYATEGEYLVTLEISTTDSCQSRFEMWVWVGNYFNDSALNALFIPEIIGNTVFFHDQSTGEIWNWYWDFGDGSNSTSQHPIHIYETLDIFYVTLGVANGYAVRTFTMEINLTDGTFQGFFGEDAATSVTKIKENNYINCVPNPFTNELSVIFNSSVSSNGTLTIYSTAGLMVYTSIIQIETGINQTPLELSQLPKGLYIIELKNSDFQRMYHKIIKQ